MRKPALALVLLAGLLPPPAARGQAPEEPPAFRLAGDLSSTLSLSSREALRASPALEFEPVAAPLSLNATLSFARGYRALGLLDFTFTDSNLLAHADGALLETLSFEVNQFYADLNFGDLFYLRAGKQRLKWGAGWVFNPSDPVNPPKDPTEALQTREGLPALKAELITRLLSLAAFGTIHERPEDFGLGAKLSSSALEGSDLALSAYWSPGDSWTAALNLSVAPLYSLPGWDTIQLWFEGSLYDQARYPQLAPAPGGPQYAFLLGVSGTLPVVRTALLAEYYHLSEGLTRAQAEALFAELRAGTADPADLAALGGRPARVGRDYLFLSVTQSSLTDNGHPVFDHLGLSATLLANLTDLSVFVRQGISTSFVEDSALELYATWTAGGGEFAHLAPAAAVELVLRIFY